ncbi:MAG: methionyl-tRNA formyltransferase [Aureispira sp.]|nr:methionyl-tRNA formyltransferase [Aureispira sp.]
MSLRIIFLGTPDFAVSSLDILVKNGYNVVAVITATDKWGGRGNKKLLESDVKKYAVANGIKVLQPPKLRNPEFLEELRSLKADLQVVVAFRMLPKAVWDMPRLGTMNLHGSLLPQYRGAAPINWAVINGEKETGVTTFFLKQAIDTGDLLLQAKTEIGEEETTGELYDRLKVIGADLVLKSVQTIELGEYTPQPQDNSLVSHAPKVFHDGCQVDFEQATQTVHNFVRGMSPYPTAWTLIDGQKLKIFKTKRRVEDHQHPAGSIHTDNKKYLHIATTDGYVELLDVQLTKRKRMDVKSFLNGYTITNMSVG